MKLLGLAFSTLSPEETRDSLLARPPDEPFAFIVTPNADHLDRLLRDPALRAVYNDALLRLFDSRCLSHLLRLAGQKAPPVVTGTDLTAALLPHLAGLRVAVIGLADEAFTALRSCYPDIRFIHHNPPMGLLHDPAAFAEAARFVREAGAPFIFFALGSPVQELLAYEIMRQGGARGVGLCIGAALEFAAGTRRRAPRWMRRAGLEWLHRLALEPRRLAGRYLIRGPRLLVLLLAQASFIRVRTSR
jgi:N-acetylglucosaminyldiphosphoundecaprenol N-acetyl-beta-D-mannosaminyltransferase